METNARCSLIFLVLLIAGCQWVFPFASKSSGALQDGSGRDWPASDGSPDRPLSSAELRPADVPAPTADGRSADRVLLADGVLLADRVLPADKKLHDKSVVPADKRPPDQVLLADKKLVVLDLITVEDWSCPPCPPDRPVACCPCILSFCAPKGSACLEVVCPLRR